MSTQGAYLELRRHRGEVLRKLALQKEARIEEGGDSDCGGRAAVARQAEWSQVPADGIFQGEALTTIFSADHKNRSIDADSR